MVQRECPRGCGLVFDRKDAYDKHLSRRVPCNSERRAWPCTVSGCTQSFTSRSNRDNHRRKCQGPRLTDKEKISNLEDTLKSLGVKNNNPITINNGPVHNGDNHITNINIHVHSLFNENHDYIKELSTDALQNLLKFEDGDDTFENYIKHVRMNTDHPENHNVRIPFVDQDIVMIKKNDVWNRTTVTSGLWDVTVKDYFDLKEISAKLSKEDESVQKFNDWLESMNTKIMNSSYKDAGQLSDFISKLKATFALFTRLHYMEAGDNPRVVVES